jgi:hypothetical protein
VVESPRIERAGPDFRAQQPEPVAGGWKTAGFAVVFAPFRRAQEGEGLVLRAG